MSRGTRNGYSQILGGNLFLSIPIAKKFINNEMFESYFIDLLEHDKCDINSFKKITLDMHLSKKLSIRYWQER